MVPGPEPQPFSHLSSCFFLHLHCLSDSPSPKGFRWWSTGTWVYLFQLLRIHCTLLQKRTVLADFSKSNLVVTGHGISWSKIQQLFYKILVKELSWIMKRPMLFFFLLSTFLQAPSGYWIIQKLFTKPLLDARHSAVNIALAGQCCPFSGVDSWYTYSTPPKDSELGVSHLPYGV